MHYMFEANKKFNFCPKNILTKGEKERNVSDGWKLHPELCEKTGYSWVLDIIDYFSKFFGSYAIKENNSSNALLAINEFCTYVGYPKILQTDNGLEYNNYLIADFCSSHNIQHIKSRPHHPQTNGVVELPTKRLGDMYY